MSLRLFIGIRIPTPLHERLEALQSGRPVPQAVAGQGGPGNGCEFGRFKTRVQFQKVIACCSLVAHATGSLGG